MLPYAKLLQALSPSPPSYVAQWTEDLGETMEEENWDHTWEVVKSCSPDTLVQETVYKVMARWYWVLARTAKVDPNAATLYFQNCGCLGSFIHVCLACPRVGELWKKVFDLFQTGVPLSPEVALVFRKPPCFTRWQHKLAVMLLAAAQQVIAKAWWTPVSSLEAVKSRMLGYMVNAKLTAVHMAQFEGIWKSWISYLLLPGFDVSLVSMTGAC